jgi:hypothetical protein
VRVIDTASKGVAAESLCRTVQGDDAKPPTYDQLLADKAALLKSLLDKAATQCADVIAKELRQLTG